MTTVITPRKPDGSTGSQAVPDRLNAEEELRKFNFCLAPAMAILLALGTGCGYAQTLSLSVPQDARPESVYDWSTERCDLVDTPDSPARAFRDSQGLLHLLGSHYENRGSVGPDFQHLHHLCNIVFEGKEADDPALFSDRQWITSVITENGIDIYSLNHDEFQGYRWPWLCPSRKYTSCWYNSVTFAHSSDGGYVFTSQPGPSDVVASLPYRYAGDIGHPSGYFQPSNAVLWDGQYYFMFHAEHYKSQEWGECVARSATPADPKSWRAWNGTSYSVTFLDPYTVSADQASDGPSMSDHTCAPVGRGKAFDVSGLLRDSLSGLFVLLSSIPEGSGNRDQPPGAYISTSKDLINWSTPQLVLRVAALPHGPTINRYGFFSLIDEASRRMDFDDIAAQPKLMLYFVRFLTAGAPYARTLEKIPVSFARSN